MTPLPDSSSYMYSWTLAETRAVQFYNKPIGPLEVITMPISGGDHGTCFTILDSELGIPKKMQKIFTEAEESPLFIEKSLLTDPRGICGGCEIIYKTNKPDTFVRIRYPNTKGFTPSSEAEFPNNIADYTSVAVVKLGSTVLEQYRAIHNLQ